MSDDHNHDRVPVTAPKPRLQLDNLSSAEFMSIFLQTSHEKQMGLIKTVYQADRQAVLRLIGNATNLGRVLLQLPDDDWPVFFSLVEELQWRRHLVSNGNAIAQVLTKLGNDSQRLLFLKTLGSLTCSIKIDDASIFMKVFISFDKLESAGKCVKFLGVMRVRGLYHMPGMLDSAWSSVSEAGKSEQWFYYLVRHVLNGQLYSHCLAMDEQCDAISRLSPENSYIFCVKELGIAIFIDKIRSNELTLDNFIKILANFSEDKRTPFCLAIGWECLSILMKDAASIAKVLKTLSAAGCEYLSKLHDFRVLTYKRTQYDGKLYVVVEALPAPQRLSFCRAFNDTRQGFFESRKLLETAINNSVKIYDVVRTLPSEQRLQFYTQILDREFLSEVTNSHEDVGNFLASLDYADRLGAFLLFLCYPNMQVKVNLQDEEGQSHGWQMIYLLDTQEKLDYFTEKFSVADRPYFIAVVELFIDQARSPEQKVAALRVLMQRPQLFIQLISWFSDAELSQPDARENSLLSYAISARNPIAILALLLKHVAGNYCECVGVMNGIRMKSRDLYLVTTAYSQENFNHVDSLGHTLVSMAYKSKIYILAFFLLRGGAKLSHDEAVNVVKAVMSQPSQIRRILDIYSNDELNQLDNWGTLLHYAVEIQSRDLVWALLRRDVDTRIKTTDFFGKTAYVLAQSSDLLKPLLALLSPELHEHKLVEAGRTLLNQQYTPEQAQAAYYDAYKLPGQVNTKMPESDPEQREAVKLKLYLLLHAFCTQQLRQNNPERKWLERATNIENNLLKKLGWFKDPSTGTICEFTEQNAAAATEADVLSIPQQSERATALI